MSFLGFKGSYKASLPTALPLSYVQHPSLILDPSSEGLNGMPKEVPRDCLLANPELQHTSNLSTPTMQMKT